MLPPLEQNKAITNIIKYCREKTTDFDNIRGNSPCVLKFTGVYSISRKSSHRTLYQKGKRVRIDECIIICIHCSISRTAYDKDF